MSRSRKDRTRWRPGTRWRNAVQPGSFDKLRTAELIRYVGSDLDIDSKQPIGIFQLLSKAIAYEQIDETIRSELRIVNRWFSENLAHPRRFSPHRDGWRRRGNGRFLRTPIAISWFKPDASVHLAKIQRIIEILRILSITVVEIRTRNPGFITYEDRHQVVAVPFSE